MEKPTIENIDQWMFDAVEGNLDAAQIVQLDTLLAENPELLEEKSLWAESAVTAEAVVYPGTKDFIRVPFWFNYKTYAAAGVALLLSFGAYQFLNSDKEDFILASQSLDHKMVLGQDDLTQNTLSQVAPLEVISTENIEENVIEEKVVVENVVAVNSQELKTPVQSAASNSSTQKETSNIITQKVANKIARTVDDENILSSIANKNELDDNEASSEQSILQSKLIIESPTGIKVSPKTESDNRIENIKLIKAGEISWIEESDITKIGKPMKGSYLPKSGISSGYDNSAMAKLKRFGNKLIKLTDNAVAFNNSKDVYYHAPNMQAMDVNFGSAGTLMTTRIQTISRAQWLGEENQQLMNTLSYDTYLKEIRGGLGVQANYDYYGNGAYQIGQMAFTYSPKFSINKNFMLEPGVRFKMGNKQLNASKLTSGQEVEIDRFNKHTFTVNESSAIGSSLWYQDIGVSMLASTKWFYFGMQLDNLARHYDNIYSNEQGASRRAGMHYTATLGSDYVSRTKIISFSPYIMYQNIENLSEIWAGSIFRYKRFAFGGGVSSNGDYSGSIGLKYDRFMMMYNVDNTQSAALQKSALSHQLTLRLLNKNGRKSQSMLKL